MVNRYSFLATAYLIVMTLYFLFPISTAQDTPPSFSLSRCFESEFFLPLSPLLIVAQGQFAPPPVPLLFLTGLMGDSLTFREDGLNQMSPYPFPLYSPFSLYFTFLFAQLSSLFKICGIAPAHSLSVFPLDSNFSPSTLDGSPLFPRVLSRHPRPILP